MYIKNEGEILFPDVQKLKEFITSLLALQEMLKKGKLYQVIICIYTKKWRAPEMVFMWANVNYFCCYLNLFKI